MEHSPKDGSTGTLALSAPRKGYSHRYPFPGVPFFKVPCELYGCGYAARMTPNEFRRYCTLLRVSNFEYGREDITLSARELATLDGIAPRTARHVHAKLRERGLVRRSKNSRRALVLVHPWQWPKLDGVKPRLQRLSSGKLISTTEPSETENPSKQENRFACNPFG